MSPLFGLLSLRVACKLSEKNCPAFCKPWYTLATAIANVKGIARMRILQARGCPHKYRFGTAAAEACSSSSSHAHDGHHLNSMSGSEAGMQAKLEDSEGQVAVLSARVAVLKRERAELDARFAHQEALLRQSMQQSTGIGMQLGKVRASVGC